MTYFIGFVYNKGTMLKGRNFLLIVVVLCLLVTIPAQAQSSDSMYFDQTKHNVEGPFWVYYQSIPQAGTLFGYPITEDFTSKDGKKVQYFQRARFELSGQQVIVSPLGSLTYHPSAQLNIYNPMACRTFSQTGFSVCFAFLEYFDQYGGEATFGNPISPFEFQDGKIVQYFEKARMEWRPSNPNGQRVVLTDLGKRYFDAFEEDTSQQDGVLPKNGEAPSVLQVNVLAVPWKASVRYKDLQRIFVIVEDQTKAPVVNATGTATINWPSGEKSTFAFTTDKNGIASFPFTIPEQPQGRAEVEVQIVRNLLLGKTTTSFSIWY
ncbi:MAG: hypothetical protein L3J16_04620 [Anaerolineales bacterium]|nr:hypothetical protein [Anaerolineales bacterium]